MKIAVAGSGIAGLAASWYLGRDHDVTLYEKQPDLGMAAHGLEWGGARVDMPLRVLYRGYYPTLTALYADAGIATTAADYSASFSDVQGRSYFRYRNWRAMQRWSLPLVQGGQPWGRRSRLIVRDLLRLYGRAKRDAEQLQNHPVTLQHYLQKTGYSAEFVDGFLLPTFAAISTCTLDSVRRYPALVVLDYLRRGVLLEGVSRTVQGADHVVEQLSQRCAAVNLGAAITQVRRQDQSVWIENERGESAQFDHLVMATQGNQALRILGSAASAAEQTALQRFDYETSEVLVHTDPALMPARRKDWSPVNFFVESTAERPMATIWLNKVLPVAAGTPDAYQTWNPLIAPDPAKILASASFERPIVNENSEHGLQELDALHQQADRRIWFCGSYAQAGVPLLESAARSAHLVASKIAAQ